MTSNSHQKGETWEDKFYELTENIDGQIRPRLKLLIKELREEAYLRGKEDQIKEMQEMLSNKDI